MAIHQDSTDHFEHAHFSKSSFSCDCHHNRNIELGCTKQYYKRDTFDIYKNKSGIDFDVYMRHWFRRSHSFEPAKLNGQDSAVMINGKNRYFRVYDAHDRLWFEGAPMNMKK